MENQTESNFEVHELADWIELVSLECPHLLPACLSLILNNRGSRRVFSRWKLSEVQLFELRELPGDTVRRLLGGGRRKLGLEERLDFAARAGLFPRG